MNKPRPIDFMALGYGVYEMMQILERWDQMTDAEKINLGFKEPFSSRPPCPSIRLVQ